MEFLEKVKDLYSKGLSAKEVALALEVSANRVYKLMRRKNISRRTHREANKITFLKKEPSFHLVTIETEEQAILKALGTALYWAEGAKAGCEIDFANSDPKMIKIFLKFLREICRICESKLRVYLYCYPQHDVNKLITFWSELTDIPRVRFTKPYIRYDAKGKVGPKMIHGLVHIRYSDKKLLMTFLDWIEEFCVSVGRGTQVANGVAL